MLSNSTTLKDIILKLNALNNLLNQQSLSKSVKDDINYIVSLSKYKLQKSVVSYPLVEHSQDLLNKKERGEKDLQLLLNEIADLNRDNEEIINNLINNGVLKKEFNNVIKAYLSSSVLLHSDKKISEWTMVDIQNWLQEFTLKRNGKIFWQNYISEIIAVVKRVNCIIMKQKPRTVQILSILLLLHSPINKGRLIQISTGEGKSTTVAMLAAILAFQDESVDIITSSPLLAKRDTIERQEFFSALNLIATHNIEEQFHVGPKQCYSANIVYGDVGSFQYDLLRHEYKGFNTRGNRNFHNVIIDEVDSMLIDDNSKLARLASHIPGTEYLEPLLVTAWFELVNLQRHLLHTDEAGWLFVPGSFNYKDGVIELLDEDNEQNILPIESNQTFCKENIVNYLSFIIENKIIHVPSHLEKFALNQIGKWAESAFQALHMEEKKHYIIIKNEDGNNIIAPVDYYTTGIVQKNTKWANGLHQFLQLKHGLKLTAEDFNTSFISNLSFFKRYDHKIYGVTGTLGSKFKSTDSNLGCGAQDLLTHVYPIDLAFIPTFKKKIFTELEGILTESSDEWLSAITRHVMTVVNENRAALVICETISKVNQIEKELLDNGYPTNKIKRYSRNDNNECLSVSSNADCGEIIIATNLAGRGTDIKTSETVEKKGGLHVCITFLPDNLRVEEQAFGRTSRQGKKGTAILIINKTEALLNLRETFYRPVYDIKDLKKLRDETEYKKLLKVKDNEIDKIETDDLLFSEFCKFTQELRQQENNKYKLMQLDECWGLWLKQTQEELYSSNHMSNEQRKISALNHLDNFKNKIRKLYCDNNYKIMQNPAYLTMEGINMLGKRNHYNESIKLFTLGRNLDEFYSFPALFNRAYASIREGYSISVQRGKFDQSWQHSAMTDLMMARELINEIIIPQLQSMAILFNDPVNPTDNDLFKQVVIKIDLLKLLINNIDSTVDYISKCGPKNIVCINNVNLLKELFNKDAMPNDEINELNEFGIHQIFDLREIKPQNSGWGLFVLITGIVQIAIGAFCVAVGFNALGVALIEEGIKDIFTSIDIFLGKEFSPKEYYQEKAQRLAITLAEICIDKVVSKIKEAHTQIPADKAEIKSAPKSTKTTGDIASHISKGTELVVETIKEVAIRTAVNVGVGKLANIASSEILRAFDSNVRKYVNFKIGKCFDQALVKQKLNHILAIDAFNYNHNYRQLIHKIVHDILSNKRSMIMNVASKIMHMYSSIVQRHTDSNTIVAEYILKIGGMIENLHDLTTFIDNFCDSFLARLTDLEQKLPKLNDILYEQMKPRVDKNDVNRIIGKLTKGSVVDGNNNRLVQTNIHAIDVIKFDEYEDHEPRIKELCYRLHATLFSTDFSQDTDQLYQDTAQSVKFQLTAKLHGQIVFPLMTEAMEPISRQISEKLVEASRNICYLSQKAQTVKKVQIHHNNKLDAQTTDENELIDENKKSNEKNGNQNICKLKEQKEIQLIKEQEDQEENISGKPTAKMLLDLPTMQAEQLYSAAQAKKMEKYEKLLQNLELQVKFQTGLRKEFTTKKIAEISQIIARSEENCNVHEVIGNIVGRHEKRRNRSFKDKIKNFLKPSIPFIVEDVGDLMICANKSLTRWTDDNLTDFKISYEALTSMGIERGISLVEKGIGKDNLQSIGKKIHAVDQFLDQNLTPGERAAIEFAGFLVIRPLSAAVKKTGANIIKAGLRKTGTNVKKGLAMNKTNSKISHKLPNDLPKKTTTRSKGKKNKAIKPIAGTSVQSNKTNTFMGQTGQVSELKLKHENTIRNFIHNIHSALSPQQVNNLTKYYQTEFIKYQRWNVPNKHAHWKLKIVGNSQYTHTDKHARISAEIAIKAAKESDVILVSMNQGVKKILGTTKIKNFRPDVTVVRRNNIIELYEVRSRTDCPQVLMNKMITIQKNLPEKKVIPQVIEIPGISYKH